MHFKINNHIEINQIISINVKIHIIKTKTFNKMVEVFNSILI